jgi:hypothetical protein
MVATGDREVADPQSGEALCEEIKLGGWSASIDDGQLHVNVQIPGAYRQLAVEHDACAGARLVAEMIELGPLAEVSAAAVARLAREANLRLPLVRMSIRDGDSRLCLRAEVSFGAAVVGGSWLLAALAMLETAIAETAREFESLRDGEVARLVLAATAARSC